MPPSGPDGGSFCIRGSQIAICRVVATQSQNLPPGGRCPSAHTGAEEECGRKCWFLHLYRLLPVLWISPFHFRLPFGHPPSPREKVCGFAAKELDKPKFGTHLPSSPLRLQAAMMQFITALRKPASSRALTPAMVEPPGEQTASFRAPGCWPVCSTI